MVGFAGQQSAPIAMASANRLPPAPLMTAKRLTGLPASTNFTCTAGPTAGALQRAASLLCLAGKLRNRDFFNGSHTAAALGKGFHILHVKDACQHFVHAALGSIQIGVYTDGRNACLHQLERHILRADLFERIKNDRVVGHDHLTLLCGGFGHHPR